MQIFTRPSPQFVDFIRKLLKKVEGMTVEETVRYLFRNEQEIFNHYLLIESQQEEIRIRWTSKNNEPRREEYLQADLENLQEQIRSIFSSSPALETFKQAVFIVQASYE